MLPAPKVIIISENGRARRAVQEALRGHVQFSEAAGYDVMIAASENASSARLILERAQRARGRQSVPVLLCAAVPPDEGRQWQDEGLLDDVAAFPANAADLVERVRRLTSRDLYRIVGQSRGAAQIRDYILKVAGAATTILITGETGTGKELVAELIHQYSGHRLGRMVTLNCAAIPDSLLESELFGHERGAYTGADSDQEGKVALSDGGTLFLDEIGDMTPFAQAKILRLLESREIYRLGGRARIQVDTRFVAATNQNLDELVRRGQFRNDLYYRLNIGRFMLPPLRHRAEDIPLLIEHYIRQFNERFGRTVQGCAGELLGVLLAYPWPGNIRELRNLVESMYLNGASGRLEIGDLPPHFQASASVGETVDPGEKEALLDALRMTNWNKSRAAERLQWSRMTLYRKMAKYGVAEARQSSAAAGRD